MTTKKLLIVDDEQYLREPLTRFLNGKYEVTSAENGLLAVDEIKNNKYSLVLLDMMMPGPDSLDVLSQIRKLDPQLKVIMMTGYASDENLKKAISLGALAYIRKPFEIAELEKLIEEAEKADIQKEGL